MTTHCYLVLIRRLADHYAASSPDLPGCAATGASFEEATQAMRGAMEAHVRRLQQESLPVPESLDWENYVYSWPELHTDDTTPITMMFHM
jgi:predicted RNase H-like HicB family nuclease